MKPTFYLLVLSLLLYSCKTLRTESGVEMDTDNFRRQMENYHNIIKVDVEKITLTKKMKGYPLLVQTDCEVLKVYRGDFSKDRIKLITEKEELIESLNPKFQTYFFFYNSNEKTTSNEYLSEFKLWKYSDTYEKYLQREL